MHTFLSPPKEKCERPLGRQVPIRAGVGASDPHRGIALRSEQGAFRSPPAPLRIASEVNKYPMKVTSPTPTQESARHAPSKGNSLRQSCPLAMQAGWLSSGQTIGAARTAVRPACCLPELRGANRLRRLYPLDTRFPPFPPAPLRIVVGEKNMSFPRGTPFQKTTSLFPNKPVVFR